MLPTYSFIALPSRAARPATYRPAVALRPPRETGWDVTPNGSERRGSAAAYRRDELGGRESRGSEQGNQDGSVRESGKRSSTPDLNGPRPIKLQINNAALTDGNANPSGRPRIPENSRERPNPGNR